MSPESQVRLELLRSAPLDAWIALSGDESRIVAIGNNFGEVSARADALGEVDAIILKTPPVWAPFSA